MLDLVLKQQVSLPELGRHEDDILATKTPSLSNLIGSISCWWRTMESIPPWRGNTTTQVGRQSRCPRNFVFSLTSLSECYKRPLKTLGEKKVLLWQGSSLPWPLAWLPPSLLVSLHPAWCSERCYSMPWDRKNTTVDSLWKSLLTRDIVFTVSRRAEGCCVWMRTKRNNILTQICFRLARGLPGPV